MERKKTNSIINLYLILMTFCAGAFTGHCLTKYNQRSKRPVAAQSVQVSGQTTEIRPQYPQEFTLDMVAQGKYHKIDTDQDGDWDYNITVSSDPETGDDRFVFWEHDDHGNTISCTFKDKDLNPIQRTIYGADIELKDSKYMSVDLTYRIKTVDGVESETLSKIDTKTYERFGDKGKILRYVSESLYEDGTTWAFSDLDFVTGAHRTVFYDEDGTVKEERLDTIDVDE